MRRSNPGSSKMLVPESLIGRTLLKEFCAEGTGALQPFRGEVRSYSEASGWFKIAYEDGDWEEADMAELTAILKCSAELEARAAKRSTPVRPPAKAPASIETDPKSAAKQPIAESNAKPTATVKPAAKPFAKPDAVMKRKAESSTAASKRPAVGAAKSASKTARTATPPSAATSSTSKASKRAASSSKSADLAPGAPTLGLVEVKERTLYHWPAGQEPWRSLPVFTTPVEEKPVLDAASRATFLTARRDYYKRYRQAQAEEVERLEREGTISDTGKRRAMRPDRVTESWMKRAEVAINQGKRCGFVPGIDISQRFYARSELSCLGLHLPPIAGIDHTGAKARAGPGVPPFAVSIVVGGWYEDDSDQGAELVYTGFGGNDLLGTRKQVKHQLLQGANAALVGNIQMGLPVRVTRKNKDPQGLYGCVLIFDGLYDVVEYWRETGREGFDVYKYRMLRRPGQGPLVSQTVVHGGISAPRQLAPLARPGIVDVDISGGKEPLPVTAVNEGEGGELPPCTALDRVPGEEALKAVTRGISQEQLEALRRSGWAPSVQYINEYRFMQGVVPPPPPVLPKKYKDDPHTYIKQLNHNRLPYVEGKGGKMVQLREALPVVYECGPWAGCPLGTACPQAASQRPLPFRLEIFHTGDERGWGVRSLDMIPQFSFICDYYGEVWRAKDYDAQVAGADRDAAYAMDMAIRPSRDWEGNTLEECRTAHTAQYVVCGLTARNVAAFFNHSCDPNCFVQPVLCDHHDVAMPKISVFSAEDIPPFTQLQWDYGEACVNAMQGKCRCGAEHCISSLTPNPPSTSRTAPKSKRPS